MTALYLDCYAVITMDTNLTNNNENFLKNGLKSRIPKKLFLLFLPGQDSR